MQLTVQGKVMELGGVYLPEVVVERVEFVEMLEDGSEWQRTSTHRTLDGQPLTELAKGFFDQGTVLLLLNHTTGQGCWTPAAQVRQA